MYKSLILPLCCAPLSRARTWLARPTFTAQGSQTWIKNYDVQCLPYLAFNRLSGHLCNIPFSLASLSRGIWILTNKQGTKLMFEHLNLSLFLFRFRITILYNKGGTLANEKRETSCATMEWRNTVKILDLRNNKSQDCTDYH